MGQINQAVNVSDVINTFAIKNFVETGTGTGESLGNVLSLPESKELTLYSIELIDQIYEYLTGKFKNDNLNLIKGYSHEEIVKIMDTISNEPTLFWHDAHFPGADFKIDGATYTSEKDPVKRIPLEYELRGVINSGRDISKDIFIIDDLRVYKDGDYETGNWDLREQAGADNIDFVYELFDDTHIIIESLVAQGFLILFPINTEVSVCKRLVNGVV
jgi:hypothetical protein